MTNGSIRTDDVVLAMANFGSGFVAVGSDLAGLPTSWLIATDGATTRSSPQRSLSGPDPLAVAASHDGTVVAVQASLYDSTVLESSDGLTWTKTATFPGTVRGLDFDGSQWLAVGSGSPPKQGEAEEGAAIWASKDLRSWDRVFTAHALFSTFEAVTASGGHRIAVGAGSEHGIGMIETSADGRAWTGQDAAREVCGAPDAVTPYGDGFLAVGGPAPFVSYTSTDGSAWKRYATDVTGCANERGALAVSGDVAAVLFPRERKPGFLSSFGRYGLYLSADGIKWEQVDDHDPTFGPGYLLATIGVSDGRFVVTGYDADGPALWVWSH